MNEYSPRPTTTSTGIFSSVARPRLFPLKNTSGLRLNAGVLTTLEEGTKIPPKLQLRSCAELSFVDKVGDFIMATSPYHIASLLDKVRRVKVCFFTVSVRGSFLRTRANRYKTLAFDRSIGFYVVLNAPRYTVMLTFSFS